MFWRGRGRRRGSPGRDHYVCRRSRLVSSSYGRPVSEHRRANSPDTLLGFAVAGAGTNWDLAQGLGTGRSDAFMAGVHGTTHDGPAYLTGAFGFADHAFTIDRISPIQDCSTRRS